MAEKLPLFRNVRWFQLAYGAFVALACYRLYLAYSGQQPLGPGPQAGLFLALGFSVIIFVVYLQNVYRFGIVPDYSLKCRFCNGPVNRYSEFCEHCGADLIAEEKLLPCPKCGVELMEGTRFCPECGARLAQPSGKKKGKKKEPPREGWDTPIDATTGVPGALIEENDDVRHTSLRGWSETRHIATQVANEPLLFVSVPSHQVTREVMVTVGRPRTPQSG